MQQASEYVDPSSGLLSKAYKAGHFAKVCVFFTDGISRLRSEEDEERGAKLHSPAIMIQAHAHMSRAYRGICVDIVRVITIH